MKDRDIRLLVALGILAVVLIPIFLLIKPKQDQIEAVKTEITERTSRLVYLQELNKQRDFYVGEITRLNTERDVMIEQFAPEIKQENTLMFLVDAEYNMPLQMYTLAFNYSAPIVIQEADAQGNGALSALNATTIVSFYGDYDSVKKMLNHVLHYKERMVISALDLKIDGEKGQLEGMFALQQYAITGQDKTLDPIELPPLEHGNDDLFIQKSEEAGEGEGQVVEGNDYDCDYYLVLNPKGTAGGTKILGKSGDGAGDTQIVNSSNSEQSVRVTFKEEGGKLYASYAIGTAKYPIENYDLGEVFTVDDDVINFKILSSARTENDAVGVNIKFVNETKLPLVVSITGDDEEKSRVKISEKTGDVTVE